MLKQSIVNFFKIKSSYRSKNQKNLKGSVLGVSISQVLKIDFYLFLPAIYVV